MTTLHDKKAHTGVQDVFFTTTPSLFQHVECLLNQQSEYLTELEAIASKGVVASLSQPTKAMVLDPQLVVQDVDENKPKEKRTKRRNHRSSQMRQTAGAGGDSGETKKKRKRQVDVYRSELKTAKSFLYGAQGAHEHSAVTEIIESASLSGAFAKKVRRWARDLKSDFLEFVVLSGSMNLWKELADWVHFAPNDFALSYFLSAVHGEAPPEDSFVFGVRALIEAPEADVAQHFQSLTSAHPQVYQAFNFLRMHPQLLQSQEIATRLAENCNLSTVVWYLEEIAQAAPTHIAAIVANRLNTEDWMEESSKVTESFGKLLERILTFRSRGWTNVSNALQPAAERSLAVLQAKWRHINNNNNGKDGLTVVFGDKSASMTSAIQAATILAAMVSACLAGELCFFDRGHVKSPHRRPQMVSQVLEIVRTVRAGSATSMAAALWPYYQKKHKLARIILVSDEGENTNAHGFRFASLLKKYMQEVHDGVQLVSICVDSGNSSFRESLARESIDCQRIEINGSRPDLSKFDSLLGQIALLSSARSADEKSQTQKGTSDSDDDEFVLVA